MNKPDWPKLAHGVSNTAELLVDSQIRHAIGQGQLVSSSAEDSLSKYACYELRIGSKVQQLVVDVVEGEEGDLYRERTIPDTGLFTIKPGETFKIYALEELYMPSDMVAITIPVGNLYKLGLNPETSFADPGFAGAFFVTVCNYSTRIVKLKVGDPLARIFFFHLASRPERIHDGKPRDLPPSVERIKKPQDDALITKGESAILAEILGAVDPPHYEHAFVTNRLVSMHRAATEGRLRGLERQAATTTLISLLGLLIILIIAAVFFGDLLRTYFPEIFGSLINKIVVGCVIWAGITFLIRPIRMALTKAAGIAFSTSE